MKILFISSSRKGQGLSPFIASQKKSLELRGLEVVSYLVPRRGFKGYFSSFYELRQKFHKNEFDVIHAHFGYSGIIARLVFPRKKVIVSFLGDDLLGSVDHNGKYLKRGNIMIKLNKLFASYFFDHNIVKSKQLAKKLNLKSKVSIIPNGIDFSHFRPVDKRTARENTGIFFEGKIILFAGDPARPVKNYQLLKESLNLLPADYNIKVIPLKNIEPLKVFFYYSLADVTVLTSFHEGSPNVIKEAMACNCPIVSTDVGDVAELIHGITGCYITTFDPRDVAEKIIQAVNFYGRTIGREKIKHLDSNLITQKIIDLYEKVLSA